MSDTVELILKITGGFGGIIGTALSIYNWQHARRQETRTKELEAADVEFYRVVQTEASQAGANCITPVLGSPDQQWAERMDGYFPRVIPHRKRVSVS